MAREIKWGILGLGKIAHKFAQDLQLVEGCSLDAVASSELVRAQAFASKHNIDQAYGDYTALFEDEAIEILYIASLNQDHYPHTLKALKKGKAVLCEKPLAINQKQVTEMITCAQKQEVFLMEALWTRFNPALKQVLQWVNQGVVGPLRYINASFSFNGLDASRESRLFNPYKGGGSLLDIGIYPVFLAYLLLGKPKNIKASAILTAEGVDEQIGILFRYEKSQAVLYSSFAHDEDMQARICGEAGEIYIDSRWHESSKLTLVKNESQTIQNLDFSGKGYTYEIEEANKCLREKKLQSPSWSHKDSLELMKLMDSIRSQTGIVFPME